MTLLIREATGDDYESLHCLGKRTKGDKRGRSLRPTFL